MTGIPSLLAMASTKSVYCLLLVSCLFITLHSLFTVHGLHYLNAIRSSCPPPLTTTTTTTPTATNNNNNNKSPQTGRSQQQPPPRRNLFSVDGIDLWLSKAILDDRGNKSRVHILGVVRRDGLKGRYACQWRYGDDNSGSTKLHTPAEYVMVDNKWPHWGPVFACRFTCHLPAGVIPERIELVKQDGGVSLGEMPLHRPAASPRRRQVAVCVKPATSALQVRRLIEWFEMLRAVDVNDVIMYHTDVSGNGRYVLEYYEQLKTLTLVPYPFLYSILERVDTAAAHLSGTDRYAVYQQTYLVAMQECLLTFRGLYKYLLFMDLDEVLLPTSNESLADMIDRLHQYRGDAGGYLFLTAWHFEDFGEGPAVAKSKQLQQLYMVRYPESTEPIDNQPKSVVNTDLAEMVNFHGVLSTVDGNYNTNMVAPWPKFGYLHHYRGRCEDKFMRKRCKEELLQKHRTDGVILRYSDQVVSAVEKVLDIIQLH